ncbi:MAG TPA: malto-oligosyltrehalose synthase [Xanthobacteraceae bacterium]|nr:malto-oligosyltrehalose synthase [Xanthobacteraceae bacterium]
MPPAVPRATYRLQLTQDFTFDDAARLVPYLRALGISHLYASPFLKARAGSLHGYDIVDHAKLNPEFGGEEAFERLSRALAEADMGLILDFVPNHMAVHRADNGWWLDVLEWGQRSPYAAFFEIAWETLPFKAEGGVLLPILGKPYGDALEAGEIALRYDPKEGSFSAWYFEHRLPIRPNRYGDILRTVVAAANAANTEAGQALLTLAQRYPRPADPTRGEAPAYKAAIAAVAGGADIIARGLSAYGPAEGGRAAVLALHRLLERQHYRVAHWRVAGSEINYRRFFDVNDLAGIAVENLRTFAAVHRLVLRLIAEDRLQGLRLDHIDGLQNPIRYCRRLQRLVRSARPAARAGPFYVVVEKILGEGEAMPRFPGISGTTGYEWLNAISRALLAPSGMAQLDETARAFTGSTVPFEGVLEQAKRRVLHTILASEFTVLVRLLARIAAGHWRTRDFTADRLGAALELFVINFPVYRTYVTVDGATAADRETIARAIAAARGQWFGPDEAIFDLLQEALTRDLVAPGRTGYSRARVRQFSLKVQQFTGPMMAKSLEDTAFYRHFHLLALNEVGNDPTLPALSPEAFHRRLAARARTAPHGLTATATHDTKRGEDARARLLTLPEFAEEWSVLVEGWRQMNARFVATEGTLRVPSRGHEYMLYQAFAGAWPLGEPQADDFAARMEAYAVKAAREGKLETSWIHPDEGYEAGLSAFVRAVLDPARSEAFLESFSAFARRLALVGALTGLAQLALKATMPGVPDFYQGSEFWDLSLVDPDNRRPVDFARRAEALRDLAPGCDWPALAANWTDGQVKLALARRLLAARERLPHVFADGEYRPLAVAGADAGHVLAFARRSGRDSVVVVVGRHFGATTQGGRRWCAGEAWDAAVDLTPWPVLHSALQEGAVLRGGVVPAAELFRAVPVALFEAQAASGTRSSGRRSPGDSRKETEQ